MNRFFTLLLTASCLNAVGQYKVGDVGPAGGWVFYVDAENQFEDWDYLEAWPHSFSFFQLLACDYLPYLSSSELGTGENNTMVFTSNDDTFSAFDFAVLFDGGSRSDWFLPSKSELEALNASSVSALINSGEGYSAASSSVFNGCQWWTYDINNGWGIEDDLYSWEWVLPIRSFQTADDGIVCGQGTIWDEASQTCIPDNPSDLNYDGCVDVNDFMGHLAAFGSGCEEGVAETPWQCGDPLEYQGYDYETVQIGEQCWFAENLRAQSLNNGDDLNEISLEGAWESSTIPSVGSMANCQEFYGSHYNWLAVFTNGLCPSNWHVPSKSDWESIFNEVPQSVAGAHLKSDQSWNGLNSYGFSVLPAGQHLGGFCDNQGYDGDLSGSDAFFWTSTESGGTQAWQVTISGEAPLYMYSHNHGNAYSIRCIKD